MLHPFQCVATIKPSSAHPDSSGYLIAACGPKLTSVCLTVGAIVSQWSADFRTDGNENDQRPAKKQKTSSTSVTLPNIIKLTVSPSNQYAVAVTDDKCVRVFEIEGRGRLVERSQRFMPKRPCAIQILPDNTTILCGDKFGDVYSLPVIPAGPTEEDASPNVQLPKQTKDSAKAFKPSATNLTVHTQRNRKSLEAQQQQKNLESKSKDPLKFEHKLLLGHVSMLTDLVFAEHEVDGKQRGHIVTADRDEHIRVSRGPPQSHVIEGYCLGHKEFVSKLCLIPGTDLLVSGGGDDWIGVWEWPSFKLKRKLNILKCIPDAEQIAVSGIWLVPGTHDDGVGDVVAVACEKMPILVFFPVSDLLTAEPEPVNTETQNFEYPILDIACIVARMLVSFDSRRNNEANENGEARVRAYSLKANPDNAIRGIRAELDTSMRSMLSDLNNLADELKNEGSLDESLYGIANLRKRGYQDDAEDGG